MVTKGIRVFARAGSELIVRQRGGVLQATGVGPRWHSTPFSLPVFPGRSLYILRAVGAGTEIPDMPGALTSVTKWIAGIVAAVVTAVLIWYIQGKLTPPSPPPTITLEGRVVDSTSSKIIHGATVLLKADAFSGEQSTDSEGRYYFLIRPNQVPVVGQLRIVAQGYQTYDLTNPLSQGDNLWEIPLVASLASPPVGAAPSHSVPPVTMLQPRIVQSLSKYTRRPTSVVLGTAAGSK